MKLQPIVPFEPMLSDQLPEGEQWIAQIKWDGVRMLSYFDGTTTELINRKGNYRTAQYPELADAAAYCRAKSCILDGEVIALKEGKPSFHEVMRRDSLRSGSSIRQMVPHLPVLYMVFDLLYCNGEWIMDKPLFERQRLLQDIVLPHPNVQLVPSYHDADQLFRSAQANELEGIVCKDVRGTYMPGGKDRRWIKRKIIQDVNAVAGGFTFRDGTVNAILLGLYDSGNGLRYIGHAGTGRLTVKDWRELTDLAPSLAAPSMPFASLPQRAEGAFWIRPELVFKIHFLEWNASGTLRQPSIQAMVDIAPAECVLPEAFVNN